MKTPGDRLISTPITPVSIMTPMMSVNVTSLRTGTFWGHRESDFDMEFEIYKSSLSHISACFLLSPKSLPSWIGLIKAHEFKAFFCFLSWWRILRCNTMILDFWSWCLYEILRPWFKSFTVLWFPFRCIALSEPCQINLLLKEKKNRLGILKIPSQSVQWLVPGSPLDPQIP